MKLSDFLAPEELFHPKVFYEGEWLLGGEYSPTCMNTDYLLLNAKGSNGNNAYMEFLEQNYFRPLADILNSKSIARKFFPKIALTVDDKEGKRTVQFSMGVFIMEQISGLFGSDDMGQRFSEFVEQATTLDEYPDYLKQLLREDRKIFTDIKNNRLNSPHYGRFYQIYLDYVRYSNSQMSFTEFLDGRISGTTKLIVATRYYPKFFAKEVSTDALLEAFDYDKFCLVAARSALDCCKTTEERENKVDNSVGYVRLYLDAVEKIKNFIPNYNPLMVTLDEKGKKKLIGVEDIRREYQALLARHPEFSFILISNSEVSTLLKRKGIEEDTIETFDFSNKENHATLELIIKDLRENRELAAEWDFIRKGSSESVETLSFSSNYQNHPLPEDERIRRMVIGREYLENSDYVYKIYGIHKFQGYIGYIYANGTVIFEKYYENIRTKKVASSSATYVMGLNNFMEMSKLSKTEIIRMIRRDSSANVRRIFHREDMDRWKSDITRVIEGTDYTDEVIEYIDSLVSNRELKKSGVKS